jgi:predicted anti-sigma-YlaC factor YlaD
MSDHQHNEQFLQELYDQFSKDIDEEIIIDVVEHMKNCPDCKIYVDSVKQIVKIYRVNESEQTVPDDVSERLFKTLRIKRTQA